MLFLLLACTDPESIVFDFESKDSDEEAVEPANEPEAAQPEQSPTSEPESTTPEPEEEPEEEEEEPQVPQTGEYLSDTATHHLVLEDRHDASQANLWNYPAPSDNGFFFTTMFSGFLTLREYDFDFNVLLEPVDVAEDEDLDVQHHFIADHATLRHQDLLYYTVSTNNDWNLIIVSSDFEGTRQAHAIVQNSPVLKVNDPQIYSVDENVCVRWGQAGYEKAYRCYDADLNPLHEIQTVITTVPTSQLGSTVWTGEEFLVFSGDAPQEDLIVSRYDEDWNELDPFQYILIPSEYGEWNWASTGVAWIPEHELWAIAYTNMPEDGGSFDGRGRIALFNSNFELQTIRFTQQQDKATFRTHLIWNDNRLIVTYDAGPVVMERWSIEPM